MKAGKLSQSVWKRSVQKQLNFEKKHFLLKPSKEEMCTAMQVPDGSAALTAFACVSGNTKPVGRYAVAKAVNDLAARGARPEGIVVQIVLPLRVEEEELREVVSCMEQLCRKLGIQTAGIQVESSPAVSQILVQAAALGCAKEERLVCPADAKPGQDIVLCGDVGLEGMLRIFDECEEELGKRFSPGFLRQMRALEKELVQIDIIGSLSAGSVTAMQQIGSGGIFGTLWELADAAGIGLEVDLTKINIRQETVEVCEYYHLNPYQMTSAGALLMVTDHGERLVRTLRALGARASMLGVTTAGNARMITGKGEKRFLDRPAPDELMRWWEERMTKQMCWREEREIK